MFGSLPVNNWRSWGLKDGISLCGVCLDLLAGCLVRIPASPFRWFGFWKFSKPHHRQKIYNIMWSARIRVNMCTCGVGRGLWMDGCSCWGDTVFNITFSWWFCAGWYWLHFRGNATVHYAAADINKKPIWHRCARDDGIELGASLSVRAFPIMRWIWRPRRRCWQWGLSQCVAHLFRKSIRQLIYWDSPGIHDRATIEWSMRYGLILFISRDGTGSEVIEGSSLLNNIPSNQYRLNIFTPNLMASPPRGSSLQAIQCMNEWHFPIGGDDGGDWCEWLLSSEGVH